MQCGGKSYLFGLGHLFGTTTCSNFSCGIAKTYANLPIHYKVGIRVKVMKGDTWDSEKFEIKLDDIK